VAATRCARREATRCAGAVSHRSSSQTRSAVTNTSVEGSRYSQWVDLFFFGLGCWDLRTKVGGRACRGGRIVKTAFGTSAVSMVWFRDVDRVRSRTQ
jgi:hypothetical protein